MKIRLSTRVGNYLRRLIPAFTLLSATALTALALTPRHGGLPVLTTARAAHSLTKMEAARAYPIHLRAVVTYYDPYIDPRHGALFVHDATGGIFVAVPARPIMPIHAGALVDVRGVSGRGDFAPIVDRAEIRVIGESRVPSRAPRVSLARLLTGSEDGQWVEVEGLVRAVLQSKTNATLELYTRGGTIGATTVKEKGVDYGRLVDSKVLVDANAAPIFNRSRQMTGARLFFPSMAAIRVEEAGPNDPFSLPLRPIRSLLQFTPNLAFMHRVRVRGAVTLDWPGRLLCIQDGNHGLCVATVEAKSVRAGDLVDVAGFPALGEYTPTLQNAVVRIVRRGKPLAAPPVTVGQAVSGQYDARLVRIRGRLAGVDAEEGDPALLLLSGTHLFAAILPRRGKIDELPASQEGSEIQVTGVCAVQVNPEATALTAGTVEPKSFRILLRSPRDVVVLEKPSWWNAEHTLLLIALILAVTLAVLSWVVVLRHRVQQQTEVIRRQLAEAAALKETAEAANRAKSDFLTNMSHEIRTPMNGVMGMIELALDAQPSPEQAEYLNLARRSAEALLTVINDILDFSKIEAGRFELDAIDFDLNGCLEETVKTFALRASAKGIELVCDLRPEVPPVVHADATRVRQVIINLLGNALKFTDGGEVCLRVDAEAGAANNVMLHFTVSDTGMGIPAEKQSLIFDAFSQADTSTTRRFGGTGLGLAISSRLVNMMGGRIWVESAPGRGSRFHFTAQVKAAASAPPEQPVETEALRGTHALVVDDNATNRRILEEVLTRWAMKVSVAASGPEALQVLQSAERSGEPFRLVLTDAQMPDMDGFSFADRVKRDPKLRSAIVMMLTSSGQHGDAARCREAGVAAYLSKPLRQAELLKAVLLAAGRPPAEASVILRDSRPDDTDRAGFNILLAEDNAVNQMLAQKLLERRGHRVTVAVNGREALSLIEKQRFDLVLMDVQMAEMDGFEATAALREKERETGGERLPVIAMTAHAMKGDEERCLDAGMDGYVAKPIQPKALFEAIDKVCSSAAR